MSGDTIVVNEAFNIDDQEMHNEINLSFLAKKVPNTSPCGSLNLVTQSVIQNLLVVSSKYSFVVYGTQQGKKVS
jgi:hypothetical protein